MVFSVNPVETSEVNQDSFKSNAMALAQNVGSATSTGGSANPTTTGAASANGVAAQFGISRTSGLLSGALVIAAMFFL
jgi:hypothetical protein